MIFNSEQLLLGDAESVMQTVPDHSCMLQSEAVQAYQQLRVDAASAGFDLRIASGFRSFSRQLAIWNDKANGTRRILDDAGSVLSPRGMSEWKCIESILRFSALPGTSRHHWGTDMDVYDAAAMSDDYQLQLTVAETELQGPFAPLHRWLDERIEKNCSYGFFRPYARDLGGVSPEPWHLSYAPIAQRYNQLLSSSMVYRRLEREKISLKNVLLVALPQILQRYVWATASPPWEIKRGS
jgi:LAS superfamily LD-carboxypeptidase LdcB